MRLVVSQSAGFRGLDVESQFVAVTADPNAVSRVYGIEQFDSLGKILAQRERSEQAMAVGAQILETGPQSGVEAEVLAAYHAARHLREV